MTTPTIRGFYDNESATVTYVVSDSATKDAIVIDPVLAYDALSSQTSLEPVSEVTSYIESEGFKVRGVVETHAHADHFSASRYLAERYKAPIAISAEITSVQELFKGVFHLADETKTDGSQFDILLEHGKRVQFGSLDFKILATPGHTPACVSLQIEDVVFTGDALFMEDYGTGRTDFPAGSAATLYKSVKEELYTLPPETRVFVGHDYKPGGRALKFESTIAQELDKNKLIARETTAAEFVAMREGRNDELRAPRLIYQSIQINVFGGNLPKPEANGVRYLKIPLNMNFPTDQGGAPQ